MITCDSSKELACDFPATSPLVLAHYAKIRAGETLTTDFAASGVIAYVIEGGATTRCGTETAAWNAGDLLILPGGVPATHEAAGDAVLWIVTNEPLLAFEKLRPPAPGTAPTELVHYRADEIARQIELIYDIGRGEDIAGSALIFSAERQEASRNILPTLTVAMNSLPGGAVQRPHRHNSVAVSLIIRGDRCFSVIDGKRKDWAPRATTVTPPGAVHSHHNGGNSQALFLIVQDGGLFYHTRTTGFEFAEHPQRSTRRRRCAMSEATTHSRLEVRPLHPALGAEVRGVAMGAPLDGGAFRELHDVWMRYLVLVFPEQHITDAEHVAFTRNFGEPEIFHQKIIRSNRVPEIFRVANVDDDGQLMPPDHPTVKQVSLAQFWHTDSSYRTVPCTGALLHGVEVSRTGGETQFTNMYQVYEELPEALKQRIAGRRALHDFGHLHTLSNLKPLTEEEKAAMPPVWQPMVRRHPVTGRRSLYISPIYNARIEGMDDAEARSLLDELIAFAGQPRFVYRHRWSPDDVVMWDNRCTMHQVTPHDPTERRVMHRTTIVGTEPVIAA